MSAPDLHESSSNSVSSIRAKGGTSACCTNPKIILGAATSLNATSGISLYHYTSCANCATAIDLLVSPKTSLSIHQTPSTSLDTQPSIPLPPFDSLPTRQLSSPPPSYQATPIVFRDPVFSRPNPSCSDSPYPPYPPQQTGNKTPMTFNYQHRFAPYPDPHQAYRRRTSPCPSHVPPSVFSRASHDASKGLPRLSLSGSIPAITPQLQGPRRERPSSAPRPAQWTDLDQAHRCQLPPEPPTWQVVRDVTLPPQQYYPFVTSLPPLASQIPSRAPLHPQFPQLHSSHSAVPRYLSNADYQYLLMQRQRYHQAQQQAQEQEQGQQYPPHSGWLDYVVARQQIGVGGSVGTPSRELTWVARDDGNETRDAGRDGGEKKEEEVMGEQGKGGKKRGKGGRGGKN